MFTSPVQLQISPPQQVTASTSQVEVATYGGGEVIGRDILVEAEQVAVFTSPVEVAASTYGGGVIG